MRKKIRLAILMLAGVLTYFASAEVGMANLCEPGCWDSGGRLCCTDANCIDYCW